MMLKCHSRGRSQVKQLLLSYALGIIMGNWEALMRVSNRPLRGISTSLDPTSPMSQQLNEAPELSLFIHTCRAGGLELAAATREPHSRSSLLQSSLSMKTWRDMDTMLQ